MHSMKHDVLSLAALVCIYGCAAQQTRTTHPEQRPAGQMTEEQRKAEQLKWEQAAAAYQKAEEARKAEAVSASPSDTPVTSSKWPNAFKRRSYQLGITISQFTTIRHPDQKEWPNAFPVFSNEARVQNDFRLSDAQLHDSWKTAGVIKSHYFWVYRNDSHESSAGLMLGNIGSRTDFYFYPENEGGEPVLFHIESGGPSGDFAYVVDLYRRAMGEPTRVHSEQVQNKLGATFTNEILEYTNDVSMVRISRFGDTLHVFKVEYILLPVMGQFSQRLDRGKQDEASKL